jgi:hypothetical protein
MAHYRKRSLLSASAMHDIMSRSKMIGDPLLEQATALLRPSPEMIDAIYREKVLRARRMSPEEKMLEGPRLFETACRITMEWIRAQHPEATEQEVMRVLQERLDLRRRMDGFR